MAKLTGQTIANSYDQLLIVDDSDGISANLQAVESGDTGGSVSALQISTVAAAIDNPTASSATQGGKLTLQSDDGAAMESGHRLGVVEFAGAEDASSTITNGARIEAITDAGWSATENGSDLVFYTTDGNATESEVMRLTADSGPEIADGAIDFDIKSHDGTNGLKLGSTLVSASAADINTAVTVAGGSSGLTDNSVLIGSGTAAITPVALANNEFLVGQSSGDPAAESGVTARASLGVYGWIKLQSVTASGATAELETGIGSTYDSYMILGTNIHSNSDGAQLWCRLKFAGAYKSDANYSYHSQSLLSSSASYGANVSDSASQILLNDGVGNAAGENANIRLFFYAPDDTDNQKLIDWTVESQQTGGLVNGGRGIGDYAASTALQGVQFLWSSSGTFDGGTFALYGLAK